MGRIADALKRAEQERRATMGASLDESSATTSTLDPFPHSRIAIPSTPPVESPQQAEPEPEKPISVVEGLSESLIPFHER